jgi:hypothetical protein
VPPPQHRGEEHPPDRIDALSIAVLVIGCAFMVIFAYLTIALFSSEGRNA